MNQIGGLNGYERKFNITIIELLQKSSNFQLLLSLGSRFPGTKTTHTKYNQKETTSMQSIALVIIDFYNSVRKKIMNAII